jgi:hypothetical protein
MRAIELLCALALVAWFGGFGVVLLLIATKP